LVNNLNYCKKSGQITQKDESKSRFGLVVKPTGETEVYLDGCKYNAAKVVIFLVRNYWPDEVSFVDKEQWNLKYKNLIVDGRPNHKQQSAMLAINRKYNVDYDLLE
jgi:hypothetical protein